MATIVAKQYNLPSDIVQRIDTLVASISSQDDYERIQLKEYTTGVEYYYCMGCDVMTQTPKTYKSPCFPIEGYFHWQHNHKWKQCIVSNDLRMYSVTNNRIKEIDIKVSFRTLRNMVRRIVATS